MPGGRKKSLFGGYHVQWNFLDGHLGNGAEMARGSVAHFSASTVMPPAIEEFAGAAVVSSFFSSMLSLEFTFVRYGIQKTSWARSRKRRKCARLRKLSCKGTTPCWLLVNFKFWALVLLPVFRIPFLQFCWLYFVLLTWRSLLCTLNTMIIEK